MVAGSRPVKQCPAVMMTVGLISSEPTSELFRTRSAASRRTTTAVATPRSVTKASTPNTNVRFVTIILLVPAPTPPVN
jgi:hypothetical protein